MAEVYDRLGLKCPDGEEGERVLDALHDSHTAPPLGECSVKRAGKFYANGHPQISTVRTPPPPTTPALRKRPHHDDKHWPRLCRSTRPLPHLFHARIAALT